MKLGQIEAKIEKTAEQRKKAWAQHDAQRAQDLTARLEELYEEKRLAQARSRSGDRAKISRRARIERELEKLGS